METICRSGKLCSDSIGHWMKTWAFKHVFDLVKDDSDMRCAMFDDTISWFTVMDEKQTAGPREAG